MENKISQKEYLKKYISFDNDDDKRKKKKKKKKAKLGTKTVKIIDDDIDLKNIRPIEENEFDILLVGEDAPQIAGIVNERGPVDFSDKRKWKIITEGGGDLAVINCTTDTEKRDQDNKINTNRNMEIDSDLNPRGRSKHEDPDLSPSRHLKECDSDLSPPRQSRNDDSDLSPSRIPRNYDSDLSPPRRDTERRVSIHRTSSRKYQSSANPDSDSDFSPPRKHKKNLDRDFCESRKGKKIRDLDTSTSGQKEYSACRRKSSPSSSHRSNREHKHFNKDSSSSCRQDVPRSKRDEERSKYSDSNPRSYSDRNGKRRKSRWNREGDDSKHESAEYSKDRDARMTKTLDGKTAGLQDAKALREETEAHNRREAERFSKLSKEVSGIGRAAIVRDRTGRKRNLEAEAAEKRERELRQQELDEKYAKWGKGLKQMEDREEKLKDDLYEMNKPLARYADDADLDKQLRDQEREGDPMLKYIREKQIKEGKRKPDPPKYQGSFAPNRFGIKPGHRWDGVDRSNGHEKKWFEAQNAKVARQEEAYKWSTADM